VILLKLIDKDQVSCRNVEPVDESADSAAKGIINDVKKRGEDALLEYALKYGDIEKGEPLIIPSYKLEEAANSIDPEDLALLERAANRIKRFARAQLQSLRTISLDIPGGVIGHDISPVQRAGCYAPGGRFPLPSSVLMTAVTAKAAGVESVWLASPKPCPITLAAAHVAKVDGFVAVGGAQVIAAFAHGTESIPACDIIVGPGNCYVTAAKRLVSGNVGIDMLAGPSELTVLADGFANPEIIAVDLLSQAEHDDLAIPILVTTDATLVERVNKAIEERLKTLKTAETASVSLKNGFAVVVDDLDEGVSICDIIAPEHLEIMCENAKEVALKCKHYGGLFIGEGSAEVLGDYGAGPNHTLPTGATARYTGGLSVLNFLRVRTYIKIDDISACQQLIGDAARFAQLEGLDAHCQSALLRKIE
jgi:histidinol dehydrogenase